MTATPEMFAPTPRQALRSGVPAPAAVSRSTSTTCSPITVVRDRDELFRHRWELDALAHRTGAPATARPAWVFPAVEATRTAHPWAVLVRDAADVVCGAVVLVDWSDSTTGESRPHGPVVVQNVNELHRAVLVAQDPQIAARLGRAVAQELGKLAGPVRLSLGPLPAQSPVTTAFFDALPGARLVAGVSIPGVRRNGSARVEDYLSPSLQRTLRKARNRITSDDRRFVTTFARQTPDVLELLPAVEFAHRDRDHARGLPSELDNPATTVRWRRRMTGLAESGLIEVGVAYIDGELAAHVVGILDGPTYRVLEGHLVTRWSRYAPGRLLETEVLQRMLDDPAVAELDWMTSVAPEALLATNTAEAVVTVRADFM
jgi:Acetyltransferase (GNAT) domain